MGAFRSGEALMTFGPDQRVQSWNEAMERFTGVPAEEAVGRLCWEVLGAVDECGDIVCHAGCSQIRLGRQGWPIPSRRLLIRTSEGRKLATMSTVVMVGLDGGPICLHLFRNGPVMSAHEAEPEPSVRLTKRQREVLKLLAEGEPAKVVAARLGIREVTARNHIRAILIELGCHSQLAAVAEARRRGLI